MSNDEYIPTNIKVENDELVNSYNESERIRVYVTDKLNNGFKELLKSLDRDELITKNK